MEVSAKTGENIDHVSVWRTAKPLLCVHMSHISVGVLDIMCVLAITPFLHTISFLSRDTCAYFNIVYFLSGIYCSCATDSQDVLCIRCEWHLLHSTVMYNQTAKLGLRLCSLS